MQQASYYRRGESIKLSKEQETGLRIELAAEAVDAEPFFISFPTLVEPTGAEPTASVGYGFFLPAAEPPWEDSESESQDATTLQQAF
eukprot:4891194-Prymnesium_polylepis.1